MSFAVPIYTFGNALNRLMEIASGLAIGFAANNRFHRAYSAWGRRRGAMQRAATSEGEIEG